MPGEQLRITVRLKDFASRSLKRIQGAIRRMRRTVSLTKTALVAFGTAFVGKELIEYTGRVQGVETAFKNLTKTVGEDYNRVLQALRQGTKGTVSDFKLMQNANTAMQLGVAKTAEDFLELTELSRRLGKAVGRDATDAFQDLVTGIGRGSKLILDNLGITVDGVVTLDKVIAAARQRVEGLGKDTLTLGEAFGQLVAELKNVGTEILKAFGPALTRAIQSLTEFIKLNKNEVINFFADVTEVIITMVAAIAQLVVGTAEFFGIISGGDEIDGLKKQIDEINQSLEKLGKTESKRRGRPFGAGPLSVAEARRQLGQEGAPPGLTILSPSEAKAQERLFAERRRLQRRLNIAETFDRLGRSTAIEELRKGLAQLRKGSGGDEDFGITSGPFPASGGRFASLFGGAGTGAGGIIDSVKQFGSAAASSLDLATGAMGDFFLKSKAAKEEQDALKSAVTDAGTGAKNALKLLAEEGKKFGVIAANAIFDVADALGNNATSALTAFITGTKSAKEAFKDFARSVFQDITRIIVRLLVMQAISAASGGLVSLNIGGTRHAGGFVPHTGLYHLQRGERVVTPGRPVVSGSGRGEAAALSTPSGGARVVNHHTWNFNVPPGTSEEQAEFIKQTVMTAMNSETEFRDGMRTG